MCFEPNDQDNPDLDAELQPEDEELDNDLADINFGEWTQTEVKDIRAEHYIDGSLGIWITPTTGWIFEDDEESANQAQFVASRLYQWLIDRLQHKLNDLS